MLVDIIMTQDITLLYLNYWATVLGSLYGYYHVCHANKSSSLFSHDQGSQPTPARHQWLH